MCKALFDLPGDLAVEAVDRFAVANLDNVRSKTGFMVGRLFLLRHTSFLYAQDAKTLRCMLNGIYSPQNPKTWLVKLQQWHDLSFLQRPAADSTYLSFMYRHYWGDVFLPDQRRALRLDPYAAVEAFANPKF